MSWASFRWEARAAFAAKSPLAHAKVSIAAVPDVTITQSWAVPRGQMVQMDGRIWAHPMTYLKLTRGDLYTRHMLGVREAERDRRLYGERPPGGVGPH